MYKKIVVLFFLFSSNIYGEERLFLTLRNDVVNLRQGPSFKYPIKIFYKKKYLPVIIQDSSGNFKKVKDHENNSGWIHVSQLSKKKAAINIDNNLLIFKKPTIYSKPIAVIEKGRLCLIKKCKNNWCKVQIDKYKGWVKKKSLWGKL